MYYKKWYHCISEKGNKKTSARAEVLICPEKPQSDSSCNLAGTKASGTDIDMGGSAVDQHFHALHIRFPGAVGSSVGVGDLDAEGDAFAANIAFCQFLCTSFNNKLQNDTSYNSTPKAQKQEDLWKNH